MSDQSVAQEPTYRTGANLGEILKANEAAAAAPVVATPAPIVEPAPPVITPEPAAATPEPTVTPEPTPATPAEENVVNFALTEFDEPAPAGEPTPSTTPTAQVNWKDEIKKDPKAVLKELGISDFAIEMDEHLKNGGKAEDYLMAKAIDYTKITDDALLKDDLRKQYPTLSPSQIETMFNRRYGADAAATEEDKEFAEIQLQADAYKVRQQKIAEQAKFKIAEPVAQPTATPVQDNTAELQRQREETLNWFNEQEATKTLNTSKRVAINLGDDGTFNYNIDKPETITRGIMDGEFWRRITAANPKESDVANLIPDIAKLQKIVLHALNPNYEKDLVNYGKSLARRELVKEGQNLTPPAKVIPVGSNDKQVSYRTGTVGGR